MRRLLIAVLLASCSLSTFAQSAITQDGYGVCLTEQYLDDLVSFTYVKDFENFTRYITSGKCFMINGGIRVYVTARSSTGSKVQIDIEGVKVWTVEEAVKVED